MNEDEDVQTGTPNTQGDTTESNPKLATIDQYERIVDRAHREIESVRTVYKWLLSILGICLTTLLVVGIFFSFNTTTGLKTEIRTESEKLKEDLIKESNLVTQLQKELRETLTQDIDTLRSDLIKGIDELSSTVTKSVKKEFKQENITELVTEQAQLRIDEIADNIIENQIEMQIIPLRKDMIAMIINSTDVLQKKEEQVDSKRTQYKKMKEEHRNSLVEVRKTIEAGKKQSDFVITILAAQSDNRKAFEKLRLWSIDSTFPLQEQAKSAVLNVINSYAINDAHMRLHWPPEFDSLKMSIEDIRAKWNGLPTRSARAYVEFVWNHHNITKEQKLTFLNDALKDSRGSLQAADWAAETLAKEAKVNYNTPFNFSKIEEWWEKRGKTNQTSEEENNRGIN